MTEYDWQLCSYLGLMLEFVRGKVSERKMRLFAVGCCRVGLKPFPNRSLEDLLDVIDAYADGQEAIEQLHAVRETAKKTEEELSETCAMFWRHHAVGPESELCLAQAVHCAASMVRADMIGRIAASQVVSALMGCAPYFVPDEEDRQREAEANSRLAQVLRCVIGNPFGPLTGIDPAWLGSNDGAVSRLTQTIYDERSFDLFPILADALEDAGCTDPEILRHSREPGEHARGCWVLDILLGKE